MKLYKVVTDGGAKVLVLELTRRNLEMLLAKLDDDTSPAKTFVSGDSDWIVKAVEDEEHYMTRYPGAVILNGEIQ